MQAGVYRHYTGKLYCVLGPGRHDKTGEEGVVYIPLYEHPDGGPVIQFRNREEFEGKVGVPGINSCPRFQYIGDHRPQKISAANVPAAQLQTHFTDPMKACSACRGKGEIATGTGWVPCHICNGTGKEKQHG